MKDATDILKKDFYIDGVKTNAVSVWITEFNDVYVGLKHPKGGVMNVPAKHIHAYTKKDEKDNVEL
jgi:hypothetical protein